MITLAAALLSGILFYLSQGLADAWPLAWLAPAPLLWLAYTAAPRWQVLVASVAAFAAGQIYLAQCYWGQIPPSVLVPMIVMMCVTFPIAVVFSGEALRRGSPWAALLAFPALWTAIEYAIGSVSQHGSYGALGYAEVSFPAAIQIAALFGVHAVTFVLCLCANAVALLLRGKWTAAGAGVAACALVLIFGAVRLAEPQGPRIRVAALADADTRNAEHRDHTLASEEAATRSYASYLEHLKDVRVAAIPEGAVRMRDSDREAVLAPLVTAARATGALVIVGTSSPDPPRNRAFALRPDGGVAIYDKRHLLAPFETEIPGRGSGFLGGSFAIQICKDMDFAGTVRGTAGQGVRLMMVPADDFGRDGWIHARMAIMRGVENGFALLRSAFDGVETISDAQGRILAKASTTGAGMVTATADVPLGPGPTLYTRIGDVFPWLCAAVSLLLCAMFTLASRSPAVGSQPHARSSKAMPSSHRALPFVLLCAPLLLFAVRAASAQETRAVPRATLAAMLAAPLATPAAGAQRADVTIVDYFDYNCPVCRELEPKLRKLLAADAGVRLVRKDWAILGDGSVYAAYASFAAARQGSYQAAHEALMTSSRDLDTKADVLAVLKAAGFDTAKIDADVARHQKEYAQVLARNAREVTALGVRGTPGLVVGDRLVLGAADYQGLQRLIARVRQGS